MLLRKSSYRLLLFQQLLSLPQCYESCKWLCSSNTCTISRHLWRAARTWSVNEVCRSTAWWFVWLGAEAAAVLSMPCYVKHRLKPLRALRSAVFADPWLFIFNVSGNICIWKGQGNIKQSGSWRFLFVADRCAAQAATVQTFRAFFSSFFTCKHRPSYV